MTREEVIKLLQVIRTNYPTARINDPAGTVTTWEMEFASYPADVIYKAARHHMNTNRYFPTIADIKRSITRGEIVYGGSERTQKNGNLVANTPVAPKKMISVSTTFCDSCGLCDIKDQKNCPCDF